MRPPTRRTGNGWPARAPTRPPILQGEKFDPDGAYVRTFVPELEKLDAAWIHKPFDAPEGALKKAGIELGKTYPKPVVNHGKARERALAAYKSLKGG